jgi:hypothetical protein
MLAWDEILGHQFHKRLEFETWNNGCRKWYKKSSMRRLGFMARNFYSTWNTGQEFNLWSQPAMSANFLKLSSDEKNFTYYCIIWNKFFKFQHFPIYLHHRLYWMIFRELGLLAVVWLDSFPIPLSPPPSFASGSCLFFSVFLCVAGAYWREKGGGAKLYDGEKTWSSLWHAPRASPEAEFMNEQFHLGFWA